MDESAFNEYKSKSVTNSAEPAFGTGPAIRGLPPDGTMLLAGRDIAQDAGGCWASRALTVPLCPSRV